MAELSSVQRRAIAMNSGIVAVSLATGGLSADILQLYVIDVLELGPATLSLALGLLVLSNPWQLYAARFPQRFGKRRVMRVGYLVTAVSTTGLAALSLVRPGPDWMLAALLCLVVLTIECAIAGSWGVAWFAWVRELADPSHRGFFVGRMRFASQAVAVAVLLVLALLTGYLPARTAFLLVFAALVAYLGAAAYLAGTVPEIGCTAPGAASPPWAGLRAAIRLPRLRQLLLVMVLLQFVTTPVTTAYALLYLGIGTTAMSAILAVRMLTVLAVLLRCGSWVDRVGAPAATRWSGAALGLVCLLWILPSPLQPPWPRYAIVGLLVCGAALASTVLGVALISLAYETVPEELSVPGGTVIDVVGSSGTQLFAALSVLVVGLVAHVNVVQSGAARLDAYKLFILIGTAAATAVWMLVARLRTDAHPPADRPPAVSEVAA